MLRRLSRYLLVLGAVALAFPGVLWAAETIAKATCGCCCPLCCG